jgi:hypothetical protein
VTRLRLARVFWIGAAAILVAAALLALAAVLRGDFTDTDGRILVTLAAVLYAGGTGLAGLALAERGRARGVGLGVAGAAPVAFALIAWAVWSFAFEGEGNETADKLAWSAAVALLACLLATTSLLLVRHERIAGLAAACGAFASGAALLTVVGIWSEADGDTLVKVDAALWILAALAYFLVPVVQRFTSARAVVADERVLAELDGVELVATRSGNGLELRLAPNERLLLRRRG